MKKFLFIFITVCLSILSVQAQIIPVSDGYVTDSANVLKDDEIAQLKKKLKAYEDSTSTQIAVVFVKSLNGLDIFDYAQQLAEGWGIGQKDKNNGLLILVSTGDRKMRVHPGRGIEDKITDAFSSDVINDIMKPAFKQNQYYKGVDDATTAIMQQLSGTYKNSRKQNDGWGIVGFIFFVIIAIIIIAAIVGRRGGGGGGAGGWIANALLWSALSNRGGSGGGWGGGGGGGGFGGWGGGSFGGGGASGSW